MYVFLVEFSMLHSTSNGLVFIVYHCARQILSDSISRFEDEKHIILRIKFVLPQIIIVLYFSFFFRNSNSLFSMKERILYCYFFFFDLSLINTSGIWKEHEGTVRRYLAFDFFLRNHKVDYDTHFSLPSRRCYLFVFLLLISRNSNNIYLLYNMQGIIVR